jgi:glycosyltransferase involved in cell wall biosynthesis
MSDKKLKILHVFRAPLGGLFRHVVDLVRGQVARGHAVGIIADSTTGGQRGNETLASLAPDLALGLSRSPMHRQLRPGDYFAIRHVSRQIAEIGPDVLHGHGAKGAAYARLARASNDPIRVYTPHGGSLLYKPGSIASRFYVALERIMLPLNDLFLFESAYSSDLYHHKIGTPKGLVRVVCNGASPSDFEPVEPSAGAADIVFIGELRPIKGIDVLLDAVASLHSQGMRLTAVIVGSGPHHEKLIAQAERLDLKNDIRFAGPMPAREAFALGRLMVVPSRAESLPYVVLEAGAAGVPLISTNVGGIPEIFGPELSDRLIPPEDVPALASSLLGGVNDLVGMRAQGSRLRERIAKEFSVDAMIEGVLSAYNEAIARPRSEHRNNPLLKLFG